MKLRYSLDGRHYYLVVDDDVNRPSAWVPVNDIDDILPFASWKVRTGKEVEVPESDPLVARYMTLDCWLTPDTVEWRERAERILESAKHSLTDAAEKVDYYRGKVARLGAALAKVAA